MSLLIDALRKAERAKRDAGPSAGTEREPSPAAGTGSGAADAPGRAPSPPVAGPDLVEAFLGDAADGLGAHIARAPEPAPAATAASAASDPDAAARDSVRLLFDAKGAPAPPSLLRIAAGAGAVAGLAIAGWVWWEMQPRGDIAAMPAFSALPVAAQAPSPAPPVTASAPVVQPTAEAQAGAEPQQPPAASPPAAAPLAEKPLATASTNRAATVAAPPTEAPRKPAPVPESPQTTPGLGPIRRGTPPPTPPARLVAAYQAYGAGRLEEAERLYRQVHAELPLNRDAINGLGAIALRQGRRDEAGQWFRRALALDPKDPVAAAGLANLDSPRAPLETESRLKQMLASAPDAAPAHFALGNALALQHRWSEAQQAYFRAYTLDADNPDYLFNLAVSLDHLGQVPLAARFYREALEAAVGRPAAFDPAAAHNRLQALPPP